MPKSFKTLNSIKIAREKKKNNSSAKQDRNSKRKWGNINQSTK
jgi:hypothetical protein